MPYYFKSEYDKERETNVTTQISADITAHDVLSAAHAALISNLSENMTTKIIYADCNRTAVYTSDGSIIYPYSAIQTAIDAASTGDTIDIWPGTYTENITLKPGVNLLAHSKFSTYIVGTVTMTAAGTVYVEKIVFQNSGDGNTLTFSGTGVQNLQCNLCNFEHTSGNGHAVYYSNTNASSKISVTDGNLTQVVSAGGGTAFTSAEAAAGSMILYGATVQNSDSTDTNCVYLGGAVTWTHTLDAINGKFVTANTARFNLALLTLTSATAAVIVHNSTNLTPSVTANLVINTATSGVAVDGIGAIVFVAIMYASTGVGGAATLNGGAGPLPFTMAPFRIRASALLPSASVTAGLLGGTFEYDGTHLYFVTGSTRNTIV